ncbi:MAG TPA: CopG family ribbon-helix-helix protein [Xanthobacteraceae bacterium]
MNKGAQDEDMTDSTTLTVRLDRSVKKRLEAAAARVRRSKSFLAAEAIEEYLAVQEWQIEAIKGGMEAADRGELVPHEQVKAWAKSIATDRRRRARAK